MRQTVTASIVGAAVAGCATQASLTVLTEPAGGYVSEQGGSLTLGTAPAVIVYEAKRLENFKDPGGCYLVRGVEARWVSGAVSRSEPLIRLCGSNTGSYTYRLTRDPSHPDLERDLQFAAQLSLVASQRARADAAGMAAAAALLQANRPQPVAPVGAAGVGVYRREYVSGMNRVCIYNRLGSDYVVTIPAVSLCPLQAP